MIVTLEDAKGFLKVDSDSEDVSIQDLIDGAEEFLKNATGKTFDVTNKLAKLVVRILITDWHENPNNIGRTDHILSQIQCYLTQLTYCYPAVAAETAP